MSCTNGVCAPTARDAVLNVTDLSNLLAAGNVVVNTGQGQLASQVKDIVVAGSFSWASASSLTLDAYRSITVNHPVTDNGTGAVTFTTNDGGSGGELSFGAKGSVSFLSATNRLTINGAAYALQNSVTALAAAIAANPGGTYALSGSYDASKDGTYSSSPIATPLTGTVQGLGNTVSNLSVKFKGTHSVWVALFSSVASGGTIANFRLHHAKVETIEDGDGQVGGLVASNGGLLFGDEVTGSVSARRCCNLHKNRVIDAGGLATANTITGTIIHSSADVRVSTPYIAGGLVAANAGTIETSHAGGSVVAGGGGGLVGDNDRGTIAQSFATGAVTGSNTTIVGGLVGISQVSGDINNSYATGAVTSGSNSEVGGFIGENDLTVESSYSTGVPKGGTHSLVGGFVGSGSGEFSACYWDTTTSKTNDGAGGSNINGVTGLTTQQLQASLPAGFDRKIWAENPNVNNGFPYLIANPPR